MHLYHSPLPFFVAPYLRGRRVEARGGFVQENEKGFADDRHGNADSLPLTTADAPILEVTHDGVADVLEHEDPDGLLD